MKYFFSYLEAGLLELGDGLLDDLRVHVLLILHDNDKYRTLPGRVNSKLSWESYESEPETVLWNRYRNFRP